MDDVLNSTVMRYAESWKTEIYNFYWLKMAQEFIHINYTHTYVHVEEI